MDLKRTIWLFFLIGTFSCSFAQVDWELKAGVNYSNITAKDGDGNRTNTSVMPGFFLGLGAAIHLSDQFAVQPTLVYARRGFKRDEASGIVGWGRGFEARVSYVELPIDFMYSPKIGPGNLLLASGPYIGYGTGGAWTTRGIVLIGDIQIDGEGDIAFQNDNSYAPDMNTHIYAKPWDYGVHFRLGYALFGQYSLSFGMQQGIADFATEMGRL